MKPTFLLLALAMTTAVAAQTEDSSKAVQPYRMVEQFPQFPGGENALRQFLASNIQYPDSARKYMIQGTVYAEFVVGADGIVTDVRILRDVSGGCTEEVMRVLKLMPRWIPGKQGGKEVPVYYSLPVVFKMS